MKTLAIPVIFGFVLFSWAVQAAERLAVGRIDRVRGAAAVISEDDKSVAASADLRLYPGDAIQTDPDAEVEFSLNQGDRFRVGSDSQISIEELAGTDEEDVPPLLRLELGYLWSKIKYFLARQQRRVLHTPTAVIGVRGTEFETVVAVDSASALTVDDGTVEIETEDERVEVAGGYTREIAEDARITPPQKAPPRAKRDWAAWRRNRREQLRTRLPFVTSQMRGRIEAAAGRHDRFSVRVRDRAGRLREQIDAVEAALRAKDRTKTRRRLQRLASRAKEFRQMAGRYRHGLNRMRVLGRHTARVEGFAQANRSRFAPGQQAAIDKDLAAIAAKRVQIRHTAQENIAVIKQTFRDLRALRGKLGLPKGDRREGPQP